jgi:hypothetical protein
VAAAETVVIAEKDRPVAVCEAHAIPGGWEYNRNPLSAEGLAPDLLREWLAAEGKLRKASREIAGRIAASEEREREARRALDGQMCLPLARGAEAVRSTEWG